MFDRGSTAKQPRTNAASAAFLLFASILTAPALAATSAKLPCLDAKDATLEVPVQVLAAEFVNNNIAAAMNPSDDSIPEIEAMEFASPSSLLAPQAEAAIRNAFRISDTEPMAGTKANAEPVSDDEERAEPDRELNSKLPGISADDFLQYKKLMYRRDI